MDPEKPSKVKEQGVVGVWDTVNSPEVKIPTINVWDKSRYLTYKVEDNSNALVETAESEIGRYVRRVSIEQLRTELERVKKEALEQNEKASKNLELIQEALHTLGNTQK